MMTAATAIPRSLGECFGEAKMVKVHLRNECGHCGKVTEQDLEVDNFVAQILLSKSNSKNLCGDCAEIIKNAENAKLRELRIEENLRKSGIGAQFLGCWDSTKGNRKLANAIRINSDKHLFVVGEYGAGKSSCTSVNLERHIRAEKNCKFYKFNELAQQYSKTFVEGEQAPKDFIKSILRHDIIVIDDVCKRDRIKNTAAEFCYELLDYIYEHNVRCRVWFTSNVLPAHLQRKFESKDLASAVASRIDRLHDAGKLVLIKAEDLA